MESMRFDSNDASSTLLSKLIDLLSEKKREVYDLDQPKYMDMHRMYDTSAKQAMIEFLMFLVTDPGGQTIELPLWKNRREQPTDEINGPKMCIAVASARRNNSILTCVVQALSAILNRMQFQRDKQDVYLHVFNVETEQEAHKDADLVRELVPVTNVKIPLHQEGEFPKQHYENLIMQRLLDRSIESDVSFRSFSKMTG